MPKLSIVLEDVLNESLIENIIKEEMHDYVFYNPFDHDLLLPAVRVNDIDRSGQLVAVNPGQVFTIIQKKDLPVDMSAPDHKISLAKLVEKAAATRRNGDDAVPRIHNEVRKTGKIAGFLVVVDGLTAWMSNYDFGNIKKNSHNKR